MPSRCRTRKSKSLRRRTRTGSRVHQKKKQTNVKVRPIHESVYAKDKIAEKTKSLGINSSGQHQCPNPENQRYVVNYDSVGDLHTPTGDATLEFVTQSNGGPRYFVQLHNNCITVFAVSKTEEWNPERIIFETPVYHSGFQKVFIGQDSRFTGEARYSGASVLVCLSGLDYVYICDCIVKFTALSEIVEFHSVIGNSAVPYPYAVDSDNRAYLMIDFKSNKRNKKYKITTVLDAENTTHGWVFWDPYETQYDNIFGFTQVNTPAKLLHFVD
jgi:hypothetical protein